MQLMVFLTLLRSGLPKNISDYVLGNKFSMFSFGEIPIKDYTYAYVALDWFDVPQVREDLKNAGLESGSTLKNNFSLLFTIVLIVIFHLVIMLIPKLKISENSSKPRKVCSFMRQKIYEIFTLGVYIRLISEAFQFLLL